MKWSDLEHATSARVTFRNNRWFVSFTVPPKEKKTTGHGCVGIDRGVTVSAMTSDGQAWNAPKSKKQQDRYENLQRVLATKAKGSKNRARILDKMSDARFQVQGQRKDWLEKTTTDIASRYQLVVVEDLNIVSMTHRVAPKPGDNGEFLPNGQSAKRGLNRSILGSLWGMFKNRLSDKTEVITCPAAFTSQRCSNCGFTSGENRQNQAVFSCVSCGHNEHADLNAAKNIKNDGLAILGHGPREDIALSQNDGLRLKDRCLPTDQFVLAENPRP